MPRKKANNQKVPGPPKRPGRAKSDPDSPTRARTSAGNVKASTVFLPSEAAQIEAYAERRGISRSAALRELAVTGLAALVLP